MLGAVAPSTTHANPSMTQLSRMSSMVEAIFVSSSSRPLWIADCPLQLQEQHRAKSHLAEYLYDVRWYQLGPLSCPCRVY